VNNFYVLKILKPLGILYLNLFPPVFKILEVTEYQIHKARCPICGKLHKGAAPENVNAPVQYGNVRITAKDVNGFVEFSITDTGVGIKPKDIKKLFRLDTEFSIRGTANEKGSGLGLILCKEFIEKNHGKIFVESEMGKGTSFIFKLPNLKK